MANQHRHLAAPKTYRSQDDNRKEYDAHYKKGDFFSSVNLSDHKSDRSSIRKKKKATRTDEDQIEDMVAQRSRTIKNLRYSNKFDWCVILSWRSKKRRMDTKYQNDCIRKFLKSLKKKYPDITYAAVRHKNEDCEGYHIHLFISGLPRRRFRIRREIFDDKGRETYCFLGWYKYGWCSAEKVDSTEHYIIYVGKRSKMRLLPKEVKSLVAYSRNLKHPEKDKEVLTDKEVYDLKEEIKDKVLYDVDIYIDNGIYKTRSEYLFLEGYLNREVQHE